MNEQLFGLKVRNKLNTDVLSLDPRVSDRLFMARQQALARHARVAQGFSLAGIGIRISTGWSDYSRQLLFALVLLTGVIFVNDWMAQERADELSEIDSSLLADDLPISAYLDRGFDTWLHTPGTE